MPEERAYSVSEVAERFGVSRDTVRRWISSKQLHAVCVSGRHTAGKPSLRPRYAVPADSLAAFELRRAVGAPLPATNRRPALAGVIEFF